MASNSKGRTVGADQFFETTGARIFSFDSLPSTDLAGGHPDVDTLFHFTSRNNRLGGEAEFEEPAENECGCADLERAKISSPAGVIANPHATPQCSLVEFGLEQCPPSTQVGVAPIYFPSNRLWAAIYNMETSPDQPGLLAYRAPLLNEPIFILVSPRTGGDYGLDLTTFGIEHRIRLPQRRLPLGYTGRTQP